MPATMRHKWHRKLVEQQAKIQGAYNSARRCLHHARKEPNPRYREQYIHVARQLHEIGRRHLRRLQEMRACMP